jgi:hypothetical protein
MRKYYIRSKRRRISYQTIKWRKANWIGRTLRRKCLVKHITEGKITGRIEATGKQERGLLDGFKETETYWNLKQEASDRTLWRTSFRRGCGPLGSNDNSQRVNEIRIRESWEIVCYYCFVFGRSWVRICASGPHHNNGRGPLENKFGHPSIRR